MKKEIVTTSKSNVPETFKNSNFITLTDFEMEDIGDNEWRLICFKGVLLKDTLSNVRIPAEIDGKKIVDIGDDVFKHKKSKLRRVIIEEGIKRLGKSVFQNCGRLEILLPDSLEIVDDFAFDCRESEINFDSIDGRIGISVYGNPRLLKKIGQYAFAHSNIETIELSSLYELGEGAFYCCENLKGPIEISNAIEKIENEAFGNCTNLMSVKLPQNLKHIGDGAFSFCGLAFITLPIGLETIGKWAFGSNEVYCDIIIPASVKKIDDDAFRSVFGEKYKTGYNVYPFSRHTIVFERESKAVLGKGALAENDQVVYSFNGTTYAILSEIYIPKGVKNIEVAFTYDSSYMRTEARRDEKNKIVRDAWGDIVYDNCGLDTCEVETSMEGCTIYCEDGSEARAFAEKESWTYDEYDDYFEEALQKAKEENADPLLPRLETEAEKKRKSREEYTLPSFGDMLEDPFLLLKFPFCLIKFIVLKIFNR